METFLFIVVGTIILYAFIFLVEFLPRVAVFIVGPGILYLMAELFIVGKDVFLFRMRSDGSPAAFFVPLMVWPVWIFCCLIGQATIVAGIKRLRRGV